MKTCPYCKRELPRKFISEIEGTGIGYLPNVECCVLCYEDAMTELAKMKIGTRIRGEKFMKLLKECKTWVEHNGVRQ